MDLNIKEMVGSATATAGLVIATAILLSMFTAQATAMSDRYRALTGEYRDGEPQAPRQQSLRRQIQLYRRRFHAVRRSCACLLIAELVFITTIATASLGAAIPLLGPLGNVSAVSLIAGLVLVMVGVAMDIHQNRLLRRAIELELHDLDDLPAEAAPREGR